MGRIDPFSEEKLWEELAKEKVFRYVNLNEQNAVNTPPNVPYLKIVCISDTHDHLGELLPDIPDGDILIHAGDFTNAGEKEKLEEFNRQMGQLPHRHKLVVAGNHELGFDDKEDWSRRDPLWTGQGTPNGYGILTNVTYLHDKGITIEGIKFYGSSWHPLAGYPFSLERGPALEQVWSDIPPKTDVLITHTPPLGYLDTFGEERWGCRHLLHEIETRVVPKFHVFGHVHECYGAATNDVTTFINAAQCDKKNQLLNKPIVFYIPKA